jgi:hypothetical protein
MRFDIMPERLCVPVGQITSLPVLLRLIAAASCPLPTASRSCLADAGRGNAYHVETAEKGAIQRLTDFLGLPEVGASTDPEIQAARRRIKELLHDLENRGFEKMSRKQMVYSSREWTQGRSKRGTG